MNFTQETAMEISNLSHRIALPDKLYVLQNIPPKKLNNSYKAYAQRFSYASINETPIILYDATVTGNAKNGFTLTTRGLYYKGADTKTNFIPLDAIKEIAADKKKALEITTDHNFKFRILLSGADELTAVEGMKVFMLNVLSILETGAVSNPQQVDPPTAPTASTEPAAFTGSAEFSASTQTPTTDVNADNVMHNIIGKQSHSGRIIPIIVHLSLVVLVFFMNGFGVWFFICVSSTIIWLMLHLNEQKPNITVGENGIQGNCKGGMFSLTYGDISTVEVKRKKFTIQNNYNQTYSMKLTNAAEVRNVILYNKDIFITQSNAVQTPQTPSMFCTNCGQQLSGGCFCVSCGMQI